MAADSNFESAWGRLDLRFQECLSQAWDSIRRRGLPVGAVVSRGSEIVSAGRNRVYDPPGGDDPLQRTPLAHAEMNAIASVPGDVEFDQCEVWTTQEPCSMCRAAIDFTDIAGIHYLATDPSSPDLSERFTSSGRSAAVWVVAASALFLHNVAWVGGPDNQVLEHARRVEPEIVTLSLQLEADETLIAAAESGADIHDALARVWDRIEAVNRRRSWPGGT